MSRPRLVEAWDILAFVLALPVLVLVGGQLPGDWSNHQGEALPGTATVVQVETTRFGAHVLIDVSSQEGRLVATRQEVSGEVPDLLGARFPVTYLPMDGTDATQIYVAGHDPFITNLLVFIVLLVAWLSSLPFVGARAFKLGKRAASRGGSGRRGQYQAGRGYTRE